MDIPVTSIYSGFWNYANSEAKGAFKSKSSWQDTSKYRSLAKERPWAEHLTSLPKWVDALSSGSALTTKEHPCHGCSDSMPSKQIIGQTVI